MFEDLVQAIQAHEESVKRAPSNHADRGMFLMNLGSALTVRTIRTGSIEDSIRSITVYEEALQFTPKDHPD